MCGFSSAWRLNREGMVACNDGKFDKAESNILRAISLAGCNSKKIHRATMYNNLSVVYQMSGKIDEAVDAYNKAVSNLNPEHKGQAALINRMKSKMDTLKKVVV
ncbi:tetratricopeptide repeat protein [Maridesulfovibrio frigidus]|uniref:tetratricopeptide repeat protein n=1 Tax=Maridesulfovibrio frigidus TaxID=340956 RepID=UPI0004E16CE9|nr:tetratricopeptide repeat protein [Maridesulfovibrio frigidus]